MELIQQKTENDRKTGDLKTKINTLNQITDVLVRDKNSLEQLRKQSNLYDVNLN